MRKSAAAIFSWCLFDWAVTPFHSVILTFIFSVYFARGIYGNEIEGSAAWANAAGWAGLAVALISPIAGAMADRTGRRKPWIFALTLLNIVIVALLWFSKPNTAHASETLALIVAATIAAEIAIVFYNAMLPDLASAGKLGRLSGWGWAMGYLGGIAALGLVLAGLVLPDQPWLHIGKADSANLRATGPLVALWTIVFAWPLFVFVKEDKASSNPLSQRERVVGEKPSQPGEGLWHEPHSPSPATAKLAGLAKPSLPSPTGRGDKQLHAQIMVSLRQLAATIRKLPAHPDLLWLLVASALYRDGLNTLFAIGGQYAAGTFGMGFEEILIFAIGMNVASGLGSIAFGFLDDRIGSKRTIMLALLGLLITGAALTLLTVKAWFMPVALVLGLFIGPAQSSARALVARLAPPDLTTEIFGLYQFAGKSVAFLGPFAFAAAVNATHSQRWGLATILVFIAAGLGLMLKVRDHGTYKFETETHPAIS